MDYVIMIKNFLNPEGHKNPFSDSKVTPILLKGGFGPLVELHQKGPASVACAAGLFYLQPVIAHSAPPPYLNGF